MPDSREDPIVRSSRREAVLFLLLWAGTVLYTVGYSYIHGYDRKLDASLDGMTFVFGWPDWVFYGVVAPWLVCTAISVVFALFIMRDAPLGEADDEVEDLS